MFTDNSETRESATNEYGGHAQLQSSPNQPRIIHPINVKIPDECMDPDGGPCPHEVKEVKKHYNPV